MSLISIEGLNGISPQAIDRYLSLCGWERDFSFQNRKIWKYLYKLEPDVQLFVPARDDLPDYLLRVEQVISILSEILKKEKANIINDLFATYSDHLEFRIISPIAEAGKLPLDYATECIDGIRNLILYSACAVHDSKPVCFKASNRAKETLNKFELGQTAVGSFIINVDAKVADEDDDHIDKLVEPSPSAEHKVVERISTAMQQVKQIAEGAKISDIAASAFKNGITANMCESFLKLKPAYEFGTEVETTICYASAITDQIGVKEIMRFSYHHFSIIQEIANIYRDKTIIEDMTLFGSINKMQLNNNAERIISIECRTEDGKRLVQATLTEKQHELACDAYKATQMVRISGVVDKSKKIWAMEYLSLFEVLSSSGEVIGKA